MRRVALVTGSSRGIGAACAEALARAGYAVCLNCIERADLAEALCKKLRAEGADAIWVQADVADPGAVKAMAARAERELGKITLLVNNAGIAKQQLFQDIDRATWDRCCPICCTSMPAASSTCPPSGAATARPVR